MRSAGLFAVAVVTVLVLSAVMPASADINLLQNPGFETGQEAPWVLSTIGPVMTGVGSETGLAHGGSYYLWIDMPSGIFESVSQAVAPPRCAQYLEFWDIAGSATLVAVLVYYSDNTRPITNTYTSPNLWTLVHVDLNTTKLVRQVEIRVLASATFRFDDFDLEACPAVGGVVTPVNTVALVAPWLAVIGLVGCGTAVVVAKKRNR